MGECINIAAVLRIVKSRLNRRDSLLDEELTLRIRATVAEHEKIGIRLGNSADEQLYIADYTAWSWSNRDKQDGMPAWLRLRRRELWVNQNSD